MHHLAESFFSFPTGVESIQGKKVFSQKTIFPNGFVAGTILPRTVNNATCIIMGSSVGGTFSGLEIFNTGTGGADLILTGNNGAANKVTISGGTTGNLTITCANNAATFGSSTVTSSGGFISTAAAGLTGSVQSNATADNSDFRCGGQDAFTSTASQFLFTGSTGAAMRVGIYGNAVASVRVPDQYGYATLNVASASFQTADGVAATIPLSATIAVQGAGAGSAGGAGGTLSVTDTAAIYIKSAGSGTVTGANYALLSDAGLNRFDGTLVLGVTVSSAGTLTLDSTANVWVASGTTTTWTLPTVSGKTGWAYQIKNRGSGAITLNSNAGGNDLYNTSAVSTITINAGSAIQLFNDGTYWLVA